MPDARRRLCRAARAPSDGGRCARRAGRGRRLAGGVAPKTGGGGDASARVAATRPWADATRASQRRRASRWCRCVSATAPVPRAEGTACSHPPARPLTPAGARCRRPLHIPPHHHHHHPSHPGPAHIHGALPSTLACSPAVPLSPGPPDSAASALSLLLSPVTFRPAPIAPCPLPRLDALRCQAHAHCHKASAVVRVGSATPDERHLPQLGSILSPACHRPSGAHEPERPA